MAGTLVLALWVAPLHAGDFAVKPLNITLSPDRTTDILTITNNADTTLRAQLTPYAWQESKDGTINTTPTDDVIVFPPLLEVGAHSDAIVRVGTSVPFEFLEKPYRLIIDEMPPPPPAADAKEKKLKVQVTVIDEYSLPIFMQPTTLQYGDSLGSLSLRDGLLSVQVKNDAANVHVRASLAVTGYDAANKVVWSGGGLAFYILPGITVDRPIPIPAADCRRIRKLVVKAKVDKPAGWLETKQDNFDGGELAVTPEQCGAARAKAVRPTPLAAGAAVSFPIHKTTGDSAAKQP